MPYPRLSGWAFARRLQSGKRLPNYAEFCAYAFGSPAGLDNANTNAWSATSNTGRGVTGSVVNAVSSVGFSCPSPTLRLRGSLHLLRVPLL